MAIAFDAVGNGTTSGSSISYSHTCSATAGTLLICHVLLNTNSDVVTGITYNGVAMTRFSMTTGTDGNVGAWSRYIYYLPAPASGAHTLTASLSGTPNGQMQSVSYTGAAQTGFPDSSNSGVSASGTPVTGSTTVVASNCWTVFFPSVSNNSVSAATGSTSRNNNGGGFFFGYGTYDSNGTVSTGLHNMAYNANTGTSSIWYMLSIGVYVPPATNGNFLTFM